MQKAGFQLGVGSREIEQKIEKEKELLGTGNSVVIEGGEGIGGGRRGIQGGINGNRKYAILIMLKIKLKSLF